MKIIHLFFDGNFVSRLVPLFEHFYPNQNAFFISLSKGTKDHFNKIEGENVYWINPWDNDKYLSEISEFCRREGVEKIVCHGLVHYYLEVLGFLFKDNKYKVYWIFWGYELYMALGYSGKVRLVDNSHFWNPLSYFLPTKYGRILHNTILREFDYEKELVTLLQYADFFCFWLYEDYQLLQKYYPSSVKFRHFQLDANWKDDDNNTSFSECHYEKLRRTILINHQASRFGNHLTVMRKLKSLNGIDDYQITAPLSYGSRVVRKMVWLMGKTFFRNHFDTILNFMPYEEYNRKIASFEVAIFGQLRQEATGNIFFLLACGTKVFLREGNVLYNHYKNRGFIIYSFEKDLNSIEDLAGLAEEEKLHNWEVCRKRKCYEDFMPSLLDE